MAKKEVNQIVMLFLAIAVFSSIIFASATDIKNSSTIISNQTINSSSLDINLTIDSNSSLFTNPTVNITKQIFNPCANISLDNFTLDSNLTCIINLLNQTKYAKKNTSNYQVKNITVERFEFVLNITTNNFKPNQSINFSIDKKISGVQVYSLDYDAEIYHKNTTIDFYYSSKDVNGFDKYYFTPNSVGNYTLALSKLFENKTFKLNYTFVVTNSNFQNLSQNNAPFLITPAYYNFDNSALNITGQLYFGSINYRLYSTNITFYPLKEPSLETSCNYLCGYDCTFNCLLNKNIFLDDYVLSVSVPDLNISFNSTFKIKIDDDANLSYDFVYEKTVKQNSVSNFTLNLFSQSSAISGAKVSLALNTPSLNTDTLVLSEINNGTYLAKSNFSELGIYRGVLYIQKESNFKMLDFTFEVTKYGVITSVPLEVEFTKYLDIVNVQAISVKTLDESDISILIKKPDNSTNYLFTQDANETVYSTFLPKQSGSYDFNVSVSYRNLTRTYQGSFFVDNFTNEVINTNQIKQFEVTIGKPVKWYRITKEKEIILDTSSSNITFNNLHDGEYVINSSGKNITVAVNSSEAYVELEYFTPGPVLIENKLSKLSKQVTVSSPFHYKNIFTKVNITESKIENIKLYWIQNNTKVLFENVFYYDDNNNSLIDSISWIVPHLSTQIFEVNITVLNVQSYPIVNGNWTVEFETQGANNLSINAYNGTIYSTQNLTGDLDFLSLYCGDYYVNTTFNNTHIVVENYACNETGYFTVKVLTEGSHHQMFTFGDQVVSAHNFATNATLNSTLLIFDQNEPLGGNINITINQEIKLYANYTLLDKTVIDNTTSFNGSCVMSFNQSGVWSNYRNMLFNSSIQMYEATSIFTLVGNHSFQINCSSSIINTNITAIDDVYVYDYPLDIEILSINSPDNNSCHITPTRLTFNITVKNNGKKNVSDFPIYLIINSEVKEKLISINESQSHSYLLKHDLVSEGLFITSIFTNSTLDINSSNNNKTILFTNYHPSVAATLSIQSDDSNSYKSKMKIINKVACITSSSIISYLEHALNLTSSQPLYSTKVDYSAGSSYSWEALVGSLQTKSVNLTINGTGDFNSSNLYVVGLK